MASLCSPPVATGVNHCLTAHNRVSILRVVTTVPVPHGHTHMQHMRLSAENSAQPDRTYSAALKRSQCRRCIKWSSSAGVTVGVAMAQAPRDPVYMHVFTG